MMKNAVFHLPGLFEFYELYRRFLPLFRRHREYFHEWCDIGSIYGAPCDCIWSGGRVSYSEESPSEVFALMKEYGISSRLTFSNSLLREEHLSDKRCNTLCCLLENIEGLSNGVIVSSELLIDYLRKVYPNLYLVSSTTKAITNFNDFVHECEREEFSFVVPDFRLNRQFNKLDKLDEPLKCKVEFLVNECCPVNCTERKACYESVSRINLGESAVEHVCIAKDSGNGYRFSQAMRNAGFISAEDILKVYLPMGFNNFKIEGRSLGSALVFEFLLYYLTKPEYQINVREEIYLDNMLDLF